MSVSIKYGANIATLDTGKKAIMNTTMQKMSRDITIEPLSGGGSEAVYYSFTEAYNNGTYDFIVGSGIRYADEEIRINEGMTVSTHNGACHFNSQLRIYSSSAYNGWAIIHSQKPITAFQGTIGAKTATLAVYGSNGDGTGEFESVSNAQSPSNGEWEYIGSIAHTISYKSYLLEFGKGYKHILLDAVGNQSRIKNMTLTLAGGAESTGGTVKVIYNDKHIAEFDSSKTATLECAGKIMQGAVVIILNKINSE